MTATHSTGQLHAFVSRIERCEDERKAIADDIKAIYAEAKGCGFDAKILRKVIAKRKKSTAERQEEESMIDVYMVALGAPGDGVHTFTRADGVKVTLERPADAVTERDNFAHNFQVKAGDIGGPVVTKSFITKNDAPVQMGLDLASGADKTLVVTFDPTTGEITNSDVADASAPSEGREPDAGPSAPAEPTPPSHLSAGQRDGLTDETEDVDGLGVDAAYTMKSSDVAHPIELPPFSDDAAKTADVALVVQPSEAMPPRTLSAEGERTSAVILNHELSIPDFLKRPRPGAADHYVAG